MFTLQINKMHLCKPLIRAIESSNLKDKFSISQLVTYRYYVGRKAMFDSDFKNGKLMIAEAEGGIFHIHQCLNF